MLNRKSLALLLILAMLITIWVSRPGGMLASNHVWATYGGYLELVGTNVVRLYRWGELVTSFNLGQIEEVQKIASDGEKIYILDGNGHLTGVDISTSQMKDYGDKWIVLFTTTLGIVGARIDGLPKVSERLVFFNLSLNERPLGDVKWNYGHTVDYIGEDSHGVIVRVGTFGGITPYGGVVGYSYYRLNNWGIDEVEAPKLGMYSHIWGDRCFLSVAGIAIAGEWDGEKCDVGNPLPRNIIWSGYGVELTFLGELRDWITGKLLASDVQDILDANAGSIVYLGANGYDFVSSEAIPPVVGKSGEVDVQGIQVDWSGLLPGVVEATLNAGDGVYSGYLRVERGEVSTKAGEGRIELVGVLTATGDRVAGVYVVTDTDFSGVVYASVTEGRMVGGAFEVDGVRETGEMSVDADDVPRIITRLKTSTVTLVDSFLPASVNPDNIYSLVGLYTARLSWGNRVDIFPVKLKIVVGDEPINIKVPVAVGIPWMSTGSGTISPPLLGYAFQASGHVLWKALSSICSQAATSTVYVSGIPINCSDLVPPYIQLDYLNIGFWHNERDGSWDMADADKYPNASRKMLWGVTDPAHKFPEKKDTTIGKLGMILDRASEFATYEIVAYFASEFVGMLEIGGPLGGAVVDLALEPIVKAFKALVAGSVTWTEGKVFTIHRSDLWMFKYIFWSYAKWIERLLDEEVNPYAIHDAKTGKFVGYDSAIWDGYSSADVAGWVNWRHWMFKIYPKDEYVQQMMDLVESSSTLTYSQKLNMKRLLGYLKEYGYPLGLSSFVEVSLYSLVGRLEDSLPIIFDMRIGYLARVNFYTPKEDGNYQPHVVVVGVGEQKDWDRVNDVILGADIGEMATSTANPSDSKELVDAENRSPLLAISSNPVGDTYYLVGPRHAGDYVDLEGDICAGTTGPLALHGRYVHPVEQLDYVDGYVVDREGWWYEKELFNGTVILDNPGYIYQHYQVPQGDVHLSFEPSVEVLETWTAPGSGDLVYSVAIFPIVYRDDEPPYGVGVVGYVWGVLYRSANGEKHLKLVSPMEEIWRFVDQNGEVGFVYNDTSGVGHLWYPQCGTSCSLPGRVLDRDHDNVYWLWWDGQIHHVAISYAAGQCSVSGLNDEPEWLSSLETADWVDMFVMDGEKVAVVKDGMLEIRSYDSGELIATVDVSGLSDFKRMVAASGGNWGGYHYYVGLVYGSIPAVGEDARPYEGLLRDVRFFMMYPYSNPRVVDLGNMGAVYVYPGSDFTYVFRGCLHRFETSWVWQGQQSDRQE